jgi:hypothetical protein
LYITPKYSILGLAYAQTLTNDTPVPSGKQATAGMLATARIPGATGMPAYKQWHQQEKEYHQKQQNQRYWQQQESYARLPASTGKASGSGKPLAAAANNHCNLMDSATGGIPAGCRNVTARFTSSSKDNRDNKNMFEESCS